MGRHLMSAWSLRAGAVLVAGLLLAGCRDVLLSEILADEREAARVRLPELRVLVDTVSRESGAEVDFGAAGQNQQVAKPFYVYNDGDAALSLSASGLVEIGGADAGCFTLTTPPSAAISPGDSTSFTVTFSSAAVGARNATLRLATNDPDEGGYTLVLRGTCVAPGQVIAPNGGELLAPGVPYSLRWSSFQGGNVRISLYDGAAESLVIADDIPDASPYIWSVPTTIDGTNYRIRVSSRVPPFLFDESDASFSIGKIEGVGIQSGDGIFTPGQTVTVVWSTTLKASQAVTIGLYQGGTLKSTLKSTTNDGSEQITLPTLYTGTAFRIRVTADANTAIFGETTDFKIGQVAVTVPSAAGILWYRGTTQTISWSTGNLGGDVSISYLKGAAGTVIVSPTVNDGSHAWALPGTLTPGNDYRITITHLEDADDITDTSDNALTVQGGQLTAPTLSLPTDYYTANLSVVVTAAAGASVCYSTDGTAPNPAVHGTHASPATVDVTARQTTLQATSVRDFYDSSAVSAATYYIPYKWSATFGVAGVSGSDTLHLNGPRGICYSSDSGKVYVADTGNKRVMVLNQDLTYSSQWATTGAPYDVDYYNTLYSVAENNTDGVLLYDGSGVYIGEQAKGMTGAWGMTVYSSDLYVVDHEANQVRRHTYASGFPFVGYLNSGGFSDPIDITVASLRSSAMPPYTTTYYLFVSDSGTNKIRKYDSSGNFLAEFGGSGAGDGQFNWPKGIHGLSAITGFGVPSIIVADAQNRRVQIIDYNGNFVTRFGSFGTGNGQFSHPAGVTIGSSGNLFVSDTNGHRVQKFTPNN